jgi:putative transposase
MRKTQFVNNEYYHIFNRGVDKREIFSDQNDLSRFFQSMCEFNTIEPIGSIFENSFRNVALGGSAANSEKLVNFVCYCLNPNHYHFVLEQVAENGTQKFMHRLGGGYTWYFNNKNKRSGSLFQGKYKSIHINTNEYLLHVSAYVNLNDRVHPLGGSAAKLAMSSWKEYLQNSKEGFCNKDIVLKQFNTIEEYKSFAEDSLKSIRERKELEKLLLE